MKSGNASGIQIIVLMFAVLLLAVPLSSYLAASLAVGEADRELLGRLVAFTCGGCVLAVFPPLRRATVALLAVPIPRTMRWEVVVVALGRIALMLGVSGAAALWIWISEGNESLAARMTPDSMAELRFAFSSRGVLFFLVMGAIVAPVLEEIAFRGFLYRAWELRWGWLPAMAGSSALFALYHSNFLNAFASSVLLTCVFRRTGSIKAAIIAHSLGNAALWYPLAGQLLHPAPDAAIGDITSWWLQLACLLLAAIALPAYVWVSREQPLDKTVFLDR